MKYYLHYVEDSTPKMKEFRTRKALDSFTTKFKESPMDGYWLEYAFETSNIIAFDGYWDAYSKPKKAKK